MLNACLLLTHVAATVNDRKYSRGLIRPFLELELYDG